MHECKTVTLRTRPLKKNMLSFYLDYYPGYRDKESMKVIRHESLGIYIYANPKNQREQNFNAVMSEKAEAIRCRRFESIVNERYDFFDKSKMKGDFLAYYKKTLRKHDQKWEFVYLHFCNFVGGKCSFEEIDVDLCNKFREYLLNAKQLRRPKHPISRNSAVGYWSTFRGFLKILYRNKLIHSNVNDFLEKIEPEDVVKDYLSVEELYRLAETPCKIPVLKTASLFSCLTSLRISDILTLRWDNMPSVKLGKYVTNLVLNNLNVRSLDLSNAGSLFVLNIGTVAGLSTLDLTHTIWGQREKEIEAEESKGSYLIVYDCPSLKEIKLPKKDELKTCFLDLECLDALETFDISNLKMVKNLIFGNLPENFNLVYPELTVFYSPEGRSATSFCCSESTFNRESTKTFLDRYYTKGTGVEKLGFSISMSCNKNDGYNWRKALKKKS